MTETRDELNTRVLELLALAAEVMETRLGSTNPLIGELRNAWLDLHRALDPHCTCNDCIDAMEKE